MREGDRTDVASGEECTPLVGIDGTEDVTYTPAYRAFLVREI